MNGEHISDERIQEMLDARRGDSEARRDRHLALCPLCRERLDSYARLYDRLEADPGAGPAPGFADSVLGRLSRPGRAMATVTPLHVAGAALALAFWLLALLLDWRPLLEAWGTTGEELAGIFRVMGGFFGRLTSMLSGAAAPFVVGGIGLLGTSLLDRVLRRRPNQVH
jgi:hypothetical protein